MADEKDAPRAIRLAAGRTLELSTDSGEFPTSFALRSPSGELELSITVGPDGPLLRLRAADIEIAAARELTLQCEKLSIAASGPATIAAGELELRAAAGSLRVHACDDVDVQGERVLLNSPTEPMPATWDQFADTIRGNELPARSPDREGRS